GRPHRVARPGRGGWGGPERLEEPEGPLLGSDVDAGGQLVGFVAACGRAGGEPLLDDGDLFRGDLLVSGGHLARFQALQEATPGGVARRDGRPGLAALLGEPLQPQVEAAAQLLAGAVAVEAVDLEDRADVL